MKVLLINGSPRKDGNCKVALNELTETLNAEGLETEIIEIGGKAIRGCIACGSCYKLGRCAFDDIVNETAEKFRDADGLIVASPVYYASPNGTLISFLDRLFYSSHFDKTMKVGAAITVARRAGTTAAFDVINKYFTISGMPVVSSEYWNVLHGRAPGEAKADGEGLRTVRVLAKNVAFLIKSIALGKEKFSLPEKEPPEITNFIK